MSSKIIKMDPAPGVVLGLLQLEDGGNRVELYAHHVADADGEEYWEVVLANGEDVSCPKLDGLAECIGYIDDSWGYPQVDMTPETIYIRLLVRDYPPLWEYKEDLLMACKLRAAYKSYMAGDVEGCKRCLRQYGTFLPELSWVRDMLLLHRD